MTKRTNPQQHYKTDAHFQLITYGNLGNLPWSHSLKSNILFSARLKGLRPMSSDRKICLRFDRVQRKSDPYHLAYFLLTSIEKNYQEGRYTFLYSNYLFVSTSVWWISQFDQQISVNHRRQHTTWESWLLKRFQPEKEYFFVYLKDQHRVSHTDT